MPSNSLNRVASSDLVTFSAGFIDSGRALVDELIMHHPDRHRKGCFELHPLGAVNYSRLASGLASSHANAILELVVCPDKLSPFAWTNLLNLSDPERTGVFPSSRTIVGWRVAAHMRTTMVLDAIEMTRGSRGTRLAGLRCHSAAGAQFTSTRYGERLAEIGATPSIGTVGDSYDNALVQTVNGYNKAELIR